MIVESKLNCQSKLELEKCACFCVRCERLTDVFDAQITNCAHTIIYDDATNIERNFLSRESNLKRIKN